MPLVTACTEGATREYLERSSWPLLTALAYFTLGYVTGEFYSVVLFGFVWQGIQVVFVLFASVARNDEWLVHSRFYEWLSKYIVYEGEACVESPFSALVAEPLLFASACAAWIWAVEYAAGFRFKRALVYRHSLHRRALMWITFLLYTFIGIGDYSDGRGYDVHVLAATFVVALVCAYVPYRVARAVRTEADVRAVYTRDERRMMVAHAFVCYAVFFALLLYIAFMPTLCPQWINVRSMYLRSLLAIGAIFVLFGGVGLVRLAHYASATMRRHQSPYA